MKKKIRDARRLRQASAAFSGYATMPPDEQYAVRRLLGTRDSVEARDRLATLLDTAGNDALVLAAAQAGAPIVLALDLGDGTPLPVSIAEFRRHVLSFRSARGAQG